MGKRAPVALNVANNWKHPECLPVGDRLTSLKVSTVEGYGTHIRKKADEDILPDTSLSDKAGCVALCLTA